MAQDACMLTENPLIFNSSSRKFKFARWDVESEVMVKTDHQWRQLHVLEHTRGKDMIFGENGSILHEIYVSKIA